MAGNEKLDLYKQHKAEYKAGKKPALIKTAMARYLAIAGQGAPGGPVFQDAVGALYAMAFTIKMTRKSAGLGDYAVCKLEALWSAPDDRPAQLLCDLPPESWCWQLMIRTPDFVAQADLDRAAAALLSKGKPEKVKDVKLETLNEGQCVQMLHVGPYDQVGGTIAIMEKFERENSLACCGKHHDIYLSDPRRVEPDRLKTIVRRPVRSQP